MVDIALQHNARWSLIDFMGTPLLSPLKGSRFTLSMSEIRQQKSTLTLYNVAETLDGLVEKKSIFSRQVKQIHVYESEENPFLYLMSWYPMNY